MDLLSVVARHEAGKWCCVVSHTHNGLVVKRLGINLCPSRQTLINKTVISTRIDDQQNRLNHVPKGECPEEIST